MVQAVLPLYQPIELLIEAQLAHFSPGDPRAPYRRHDAKAHRLGLGLWPLPLELEVEVDLAPGAADKGPRSPVGNRVLEATLNLGIGGQTPDGLIQTGTKFGDPSL